VITVAVTATGYVGARTTFGTIFCIFHPIWKKSCAEDDQETVLSNIVSVVRTGAVTTVLTARRAMFCAR
jgi:hypothetical protein